MEHAALAYALAVGQAFVAGFRYSVVPASSRKPAAVFDNAALKLPETYGCTLHAVGRDSSAE